MKVFPFQRGHPYPFSHLRLNKLLSVEYSMNYKYFFNNLSTYSQSKVFVVSTEIIQRKKQKTRSEILFLIVFHIDDAMKKDDINFTSRKSDDEFLFVHHLKKHEE